MVMWYIKAYKTFFNCVGSCVSHYTYMYVGCYVSQSFSTWLPTYIAPLIFVYTTLTMLTL